MEQMNNCFLRGFQLFYVIICIYVNTIACDFIYLYIVDVTQMLAVNATLVGTDANTFVRNNKFGLNS
jgi:hypothetical protein